MHVVSLTGEPERQIHTDELVLEYPQWTRKREIKEYAIMAISHHPPSLYGHCLRVRIGGRSLYLCGRCTGIYGGLVAGMAAIILLGIPLQPAWLWFSVAVSVGLATVVDWVTQRITPRKTTVRIRVLTGLASGLSLAVIFLIGDVIYMTIAIGVMIVSIGVVGMQESRSRRRRSRESKAHPSQAPLPP
jgi:uncharacterized membrane protein